MCARDASSEAAGGPVRRFYVLGAICLWVYVWLMNTQPGGCMTFEGVRLLLQKVVGCFCKDGMLLTAESSSTLFLFVWYSRGWAPAFARSKTWSRNSGSAYLLLNTSRIALSVQLVRAQSRHRTQTANNVKHFFFLRRPLSGCLRWLPIFSELQSTH